MKKLLYLVLTTMFVGNTGAAGEDNPGACCGCLGCTRKQEDWHYRVTFTSLLLGVPIGSLTSLTGAPIWASTISALGSASCFYYVGGKIYSRSNEQIQEINRETNQDFRLLLDLFVRFTSSTEVRVVGQQIELPEEVDPNLIGATLGVPPGDVFVVVVGRPVGNNFQISPQQETMSATQFPPRPNG